MKKSTTVLLCIMIASFVLSMIFFFVSGAIFIGSGVKEVAECITSGDSDIIGSCDGIEVSKDDGVKVDLPGIHVIVDDKGTDVKVLGIHVDFRDDDDEATKS
ncbi:MAG: hypothetical protein J5752_04440 [Clostridiales bacterium]|nr:hypothetical protein [Clostridiales bacterium]